MDVGKYCKNGRERIKTVIAEIWQFFKATPYACKLICRYEPRLLIWLAIATVLDGVAPSIAVWIMRYFLDALVEAYNHPGEAIYTKQALVFCLLQAGITGAVAIINKRIAFTKSVLASKLCLGMQTDLNISMSRLEMKDYENPETHNMLARAQIEAKGNKPLAIVSSLSRIVSSIITLTTFIIILLPFSLYVVLAVVPISIPYLITHVYFARLQYRFAHERTERERFTDYVSKCFTRSRAIPEIFAFDLWAFLTDKWKEVAKSLEKDKIDLSRRNNKSEIGVILVTHLGRGAVSACILWKCLRTMQVYSLGQLTMFLQAFNGAVNSLVLIMQECSSIYEGSCFLRTYEEFEGQNKNQQACGRKLKKVNKRIKEIEFRNVSYRYPGREDWALENINLKLQTKQRTLLIGKNGSGKSTIARLILGLYVPTQGQILVDGVDTKELDRKEMRKNMSCIFQEFGKYPLTVRENIGLGSVDEINRVEAIHRAVKTARMEHVIHKLPKGYETMMGTELSGGSDLSLGEWQRIALARLFMRNASVLIYDEPGASLDIETEAEIMKQIQEANDDAIYILITHRLMRSDIADYIVLLEKGRIIEEGTHNKLFKHKTQYAHLWHCYWKGEKKDLL